MLFTLQRYKFLSKSQHDYEVFNRQRRCCLPCKGTKEKELDDMGKLVNSILDFAQRMADRRIPMTMEDWAKRIDIVLEAGGDAVLNDAGQVTAEYAKEYAESEFEKYRIIQDRLFKSDFDKFDEGDNLLPLDFKE